MQEDYVECSELSGRTIRTLRIYKDSGDGTDVQIELTDGTSFSCSFCHQPAVKAFLYRGGVGTPQTIRSYEV
jgi:aerobic-type carbon monoxide dehydrogenase small subunit (CoxS/CutS family)